MVLIEHIHKPVVFISFTLDHRVCSFALAPAAVFVRAYIVLMDGRVAVVVLGCCTFFFGLRQRTCTESSVFEARGRAGEEEDKDDDEEDGREVRRGN
jgi:hypothetical protein